MYLEGNQTLYSHKYTTAGRVHFEVQVHPNTAVLKSKTISSTI